MKTFIKMIILAGLLIVNILQAAEMPGFKSIPLAKGARHTIMPFIGYQILDGEQMGFNLSDEFFDFITLSPFSVDEEQRYERNVKSPETGIIYRYRTPINLIQVEAGLSLIHDAANYNRTYIIYFGDYSQPGKVMVSHKNTLITSLSLVVDVPTGLNFITSSLIIGGGYGKRDIKGELDRELTRVGVFKVTDSEELLMTRVGFEAALWNKDNFLMKGSLYYSHLSPLDDRNDAFGGIGWSFGFFPIWSEIR